MADLKLFRIDQGQATEMPSSSVALERDLQKLVEANLETIFGIRFLASEYTTGKVHRGRIDSLGIDEIGSPVILEYKRTINENVINQGLFILTGSWTTRESSNCWLIGILAGKWPTTSTGRHPG